MLHSVKGRHQALALLFTFTLQVGYEPFTYLADELGFLSINEYLQAAGGPPNIFACGDVATSTVYPRPKAGVFAVRQGPPLTDNIRR